MTSSTPTPIDRPSNPVRRARPGVRLCIAFAIAVEILILWVERDMLRRMTPPGLALLGGVSAVGCLMVAIEAFKLPLTFTWHSLRRRWARGIAMAAGGLCCVVSYEAIMTSFSKTHELHLAPATEALAARDRLDAEIARLTAENGRLDRVSADAIAEADRIRAEAGEEGRRLDAAYAAADSAIARALADLRAAPNDADLIRLRDAESERAAVTVPKEVSDRIASLTRRRTELESRATEVEQAFLREVEAIRAAEAAAAVGTERSNAERREAAALRRAEATQRIAAIEDSIRELRQGHADEISEIERTAGLFDKGRRLAEANERFASEQRRLLDELALANARLAAADHEATASIASATQVETSDARLAEANSRHAARAAAAKGEVESVVSELIEAERAATRGVEAARAALDAEIARIRQAAEARQSERDTTTRARQAELEQSREAARAAFDRDIREVRERRDRQLAAVEANLVTPAQALALKASNSARIDAAGAERVGLSEQILAAQRSSPVHQLARIVAAGGEPTRDEIQWTFRILVPAIGLVAAVMPSLMLKLSLQALAEASSNRRRERSFLRYRRRILLRLLESRSLHRRSADEGLRQLTDTRARIRELDDTITQQRERHASELAELRLRHKADLSTCETAREAEQAAANRRLATIIASHDDSTARLQREHADLLAAARHRESQSCRAARRAAARRIRSCRARARCAAERRVIRTIRAQQGTIGGLESTAHSLRDQLAHYRTENAALNALVRDAKDDIIETRKECIEAIQAIPVAHITVDRRHHDDP